MREVCVDLDHEVEAARDADGVTGAVRAAQTHLLRSPQDFDAAELRAERFCLLGGSVEAVVVDHENVCGRHGYADPADQLLDVLGFLVRRDGDPHAQIVAATPRFARVVTIHPGSRSLADAGRSRTGPECARRCARW